MCGMPPQPATRPEGPHRVLQLASTSDMGGTERMILFLVEALDKTRFIPHVGCLVGGGELLDRAAPHYAGTCHFQAPNALSPAAVRRIARYVRENRIDLVQTYGLRADTAGRIAARIGGARVVVSSIRSIDPWRKWYHVLLDRLTAPLVDLVISNSEAGRLASIERREFAPKKIRTIYSGIPARELHAEDRASIRGELAIPPDAFPVIVILANLREMKGHRDVVEALPAIRAAHPQVQFIFAGRDDSGGEIEQLARERGVHDAICFVGYYADTPRLLAASDIFMLPSHWEGLPVSVIEAMHAGMPIITTRVGGIPELVRDGHEALLIEPARPDMIASAVQRLASDSGLRERFGAGARERARREFSIEAMASAIERTYEELLDRKR
jgi:glycosyltransferase involved in cell wall biosynthesis